MKAAAGSYLILARPRSRTAWLSALLYCDIPCFHDDLTRLHVLLGGGPFGFAAPSMPIMSLEPVTEAFADCPVVVIDRPAAEAYDAADTFLGFQFPRGAFEQRFMKLLELLPPALTVPYLKLDEYETVDRIHRHCLGRPLDRNRFRAFDLLRIEQHLSKVAASAPPDVIRRLTWPG